VKVLADLTDVNGKLPVEIGEREGLLKTYDTHTLSISSLKGRVHDLELDVHDLGATKQSLQVTYLQAVEAFKAELANLEKANADLNDINIKLRKIRKENDGVFFQVNELKAKIKQLAAEEAAIEGAEAALRQKEENERLALAELRKKEREEQEIIIVTKKALIEASHTLQDNETYHVRHKQNIEKATFELNSLREAIDIRDKEIAFVIEDCNATAARIVETNKAFESNVKAIQVLEYKQASLSHLESELDEKIKELANKEASEHVEFEKVEARIVSLRTQLDHVLGEIAKAKVSLTSFTKEHEHKTGSAEKEIKALEAEYAHHQEVFSSKEKVVQVFEIKGVKYSAPKRAERKKKKIQRRKEGKRKPKFNRRQISSSSSSSSD